MHYVNDGQLLPGDATSEREQVRQALKKNVEFYQTRSLDSASAFTSFFILAIRRKQNIDCVGEHFVDHGSW